MEKLIKMKCPTCGRITSHYLNDKGEYKCCICQHVNKTIKHKEVVFESEFDDDLKEPVNELEEQFSPEGFDEESTATEVDNDNDEEFEEPEEVEKAYKNENNDDEYVDFEEVNGIN